MMPLKISVFNNEELDAFREEFQDESPRAAAVLAGAYIEEHLKSLLKKRLVGEVKEIDNLIESKLPAKQLINLCYSSGILCNEIRDDLAIIFDIRNEFAHNRHLNDFNVRTDKKDIPAECDRILIVNVLKANKILTDEDPRDKFTVAVLAYIFEEILK